MASVRRLGPGEVGAVVAASHLFDEPVTEEWAAAFLAGAGNHLLVAYVDDRPAGFVTGVEVLHPDKGPEMMLYELGVDEPYRRRGVGSHLVRRLVDLARRRGCRTVWVLTEPDNAPAAATYRRAGFSGPVETALLEHSLGDP